MQKTIVVEVEMRKAHAKYKRIVARRRKFYAHDEQSSARLGDVVRIRETRPLSKLKRWSLEECAAAPHLGQIEDAAPKTESSQLTRARRRRTHGCANENHARGADNSGARKLQVILRWAVDWARRRVSAIL